MATRPKFKNRVEMTFRISNDFGDRKAIKKVSDKMIVISAYKACGYDAEHHKNPAFNAEIHIFSGDAQKTTETDFTKDHFPKPGDYIDVKGFLTTRGYMDKDGVKRTTYVIKAEEVKFSEMEEYDDPAYESSADMWG